MSYPANIDGHDVNVVQGSGPPVFIATFYFDKQTGLLLRMVRYANSAVGRVPTQIDFSDYRPVAGVMMPFRRTYGWVSGREEYTLTEIKPNVPVDDAKFVKTTARAKITRAGALSVACDNPGAHSAGCAPRLRKPSQPAALCAMFE